MQALNGRTILLLTLPQMLWAGNTIVGRLLADQLSPITLNLLRWTIAALLLLPFAGWVLKKDSPLWAEWKRFALLGLLGIGCYNALQYWALETSTPMNVTLVASSMPLWMLLVGRFFFGAPIATKQVISTALSITGVLFVLSRGEWSQLLNLKLVPGDLFVIAAAICWAGYSWILAQRKEPEAIRANWAAMLLGQIVFGLLWSSAASGLEWASGLGRWEWSPTVVAALLFFAVGPSLASFACWGKGVAAAGPQLASFFVNLIPVFTAIFSTLILGEAPQWYHLVAFAFIVAGILVSAKK